MDPEEASKAIETARQRRYNVYHKSISKQQAPFLKDGPAKGSMWISRVTVPGGGGHVIVQAIEEVIRVLGNGSETYDVPTYHDVKAEWVGYRLGVDRSALEPNISEKEKYDLLMKEVESDSVMFYAHGGASYVGSPASSRPMTSKLASISRGRVFSVSYRLAPQDPFPAQLIDLLLAYLSLLNPPPGSFHTAIPASKIVFIGDSFGATLLLALIQVILTLSNHPASSTKSRTILFRSCNVPIPLPAGIALVSPYSYTPQHFASWENNALHDTFPMIQGPFFVQPYFPFCDAWPTNPPRGDIYCDTSMLGHPLVCTAAAKSWRGSPPMYLASGQERCIDSAKVIASQAARDGVTVCWEEYQGMSHVFMIYFPGWRQSDMCYERWAAFVKKCVDAEKQKTRGCVIGVQDLMEREVDVWKLTKLTPGYAAEILEGPKMERKVWEDSLKRRKSVL